MEDIDGKMPGEARGKQDEAQKATTSPGDAMRCSTRTSCGAAAGQRAVKERRIS